MTTNNSRGVDFDNGVDKASLLDGALNLLPAATSPYSIGRVSYDPTSKGHIADTGFTDVRLNMGRENHILVHNNTGVQIDNGEPVSADGTITADVPNVSPTDTLSILSSRGFAGVATMNIPDGQQGVVTPFGLVNDVDTSLLSLGFIYADGLGGFTQTRPKFPQNRLIIGGVVKVGALNGIISVNPQIISRNTLAVGYPFTSSGVGAGTFYIAGSYDWPAADANLTQASLTVAYGTAGSATGAHAGIVAGAAGTVDTGVVGIRVNGDSFTDAGITTIDDTEILSSDITALSTDEYLETSKNWTGDIEFELFVVSGTPVNYSLDFNYGFSAYVDASNTDATLTGFRVEGICGGTDAGFNVQLKKHSALIWTYAATGFAPGNGDIVNMATDMAPNSTIVNGKSFKYKRDGLTEFVEGSDGEGFLIAVTTTNNNAVQSMLATPSGFSEELT